MRGRHAPVIYKWCTFLSVLCAPLAPVCGEIVVAWHETGSYAAAAIAGFVIGVR